MTFIIGVNLSDRVYLSADTRLTFKNEKYPKYLDTILKIKPISQEIAVAAAGDLKLASFIVKGIIASTIIKKNIRKFRKSIEEQIINLVNEYQKKYKRFGTEACFIFAGINREKKKVIDMKKYVEIVSGFQKEKNGPMNTKDIIFQGLENKKHGNLVEIPVSDSLVFCIQVSPRGIKTEDVEWGDYIAHGAGLTKENLPRRFFGQFEVSARAGDYKHDKMWLDIFMKSIAGENNKNTIGGSITTLIISESISGILLGGTGRFNLGRGGNEIISEVKIIDKKPHCLIDGKMQKLVSFIGYEDMFLDHPSVKEMTL